MNDLYHVIGGALSAWLVILMGRKAWHYGTVIATAMFSGFIVNWLWETLADKYHLLPFHAGYPDAMDIARGGVASVIFTLAYLIIRRGKL